MNKLFFWREWTRVSQYIYFVALTLFTTCVSTFLFSQLYGKYHVLGWDVSTEVYHTQTIVDSFQKGFFEFHIDAPSHYLVQAFEGTSYSPNAPLTYAFLGIIALSLVGGSVAISFVRGVWYYASLLLLGVYVYFLHLDVLQVIGLSPMYWPVIVFLLLGGGAHIFHDFRPDIKLEWRYAAFLILVILLGIITIQFSGLEEPVFHLVAYGWLAPFVLALVYIFMISAEIYQGFLFVATDSKHAKPSSSLINFMIMSLVYLGNVVLTFLKNRHSIDWDLLYLEAPVLLVVSAVLGIWGNKKKESLYKNISYFSPPTAIWHMLMALNCFACYSYVNMIGNDALQEVMEDTVIFTQITTGIMILVFILINFWGFMSLNLPVHMVVYQPKYMPFGFVRIISAIGLLSIVLYNNDYQYRQALGGYYTEIAEVYAKQHNDLLANEYYLSAIDLDGGSHKANYALAMHMRSKGGDDVLVKSYLNRASFKNPSPQLYANLGHFLLRDGDIIRSLEALREGKGKFPESPEILNNMALSFGQTRISDSVFHYLKLSNRIKGEHPVAASNQLAFLIKYNIPVKELAFNSDEKDEAYRANALAFGKRMGVPVAFSFDTRLLSDTSLTNEKMAYVFNSAVYSLKDTNSFRISWLDTLLHKKANERYFEQLNLAKAMTAYYGGKVGDGIVTLDQLQATGAGVIQYNNLMANWLIQQEAPRVAMDFLDKAKQAGDLNVNFGMAIAGSFYLPPLEAISLWKDQVVQTDSGFRAISAQLQSGVANVYRIGILPQSLISSSDMVNSFKKLPANNDKNRALARVLNELNRRDQPDLVVQIFQENGRTTLSEWEYVRALRMLGKKKEVGDLAPRIQLPSALYLQAWSQENANPQVAEDIYKRAFEEAPFYDQGILDGIEFLKKKWSKEKVYDLLLTSVMLNTYSVPLEKAYARQCVEMNLFGFADYTVNKLKDLMPKAEHAIFATEIAKQKEVVTNNIDWK